MAKSAWEKALEKNVKKQIEANKRIVAKQEREAKQRARIEARRTQAASIVNGQLTVGSVRFLDKTAEELVAILADGYRREDYVVTNADVIIPIYLEKNLSLEFEKLKQYGMISDYRYWITGCWEVNILPCLLTYFEDKERVCMQNPNNINNFYGDVTGIQIQQGAVNSSQEQTINQGADYETAVKIVEQIRKYDALLDNEFGENASELRSKVDELAELVEKKNNPSKVKIILTEIKNLALGVSGSLIASGLLTLL